MSADGATTLSFWATDNAGATSPTQSLTVQVDRTAPAVACATPSSAWSSTDVTVACTASDGLSGSVTIQQVKEHMADFKAYMRVEITPRHWSRKDDSAE